MRVNRPIDFVQFLTYSGVSIFTKDCKKMFKPEFTVHNHQTENTQPTIANVNVNSSFITVLGELQIQGSELHIDNYEIEANSVDLDLGGKLTIQNTIITPHSIRANGEISVEFNRPSYFLTKLANGNAAPNHDGEIWDPELENENSTSTIRSYNFLGRLSGELDAMGNFTSYSDDTNENNNDTEQTIHSHNYDEMLSDPEMPELEESDSEAAPSCPSLYK